MSSLTDLHNDLRQGVRQLCAHYPDEYWRKLDKNEAYPTEFVTAMTEAGYLAALIPEEFGVTEPDAGTDTTNIRTTATREGDEYVVRGQKIWTSLYSDLMLLLARTTPRDQVKKRTHGLSIFLIDLKQEIDISQYLDIIGESWIW